MNLEQSLEIASHSDPGMVRSHNEDSIASDASKGLAVLADGMGGGNAGEVASGMATTVLTNDLRQALKTVAPGGPTANRNESRAFALLRDRVGVVNNSIFQAAEHQPQYAGMGTTVV